MEEIVQTAERIRLFTVAMRIASVISSYLATKEDGDEISPFDLVHTIIIGISGDVDEEEKKAINLLVDVALSAQGCTSKKLICM
jgi:hypothetical protein